MNPLEVINETEAARYLGMSVHSLRARRFTGRQPAYIKFGKSVRYLKSDLEVFIETSRVTSSDRA
ncbi:MAG: helix-turn-helix domain-containing protein [Humidesulfovibrio sp.]|uniref:helix-turn-helix transcriptional regulator n=1 Tax=Humidesulfovibrio sp. TaxID=2910988 RepID=UPI0027FAE646|nr:helix-turn-helix domain-containing protein [Humidesulfovibrio sp.]MDQ7835336.1 helix-turn-helix domain-containing protein [Humidesulfovibrio sp.]